MKGIASRVTRGLPVGAEVRTIDNSGAKLVAIVGVRGHKTVKGRIPAGGVGDIVTVRVIKGKPEMRNKVALAVIVRQKKEYRRANGLHVKFEDNAVVILKDEKGNPKGTILKGPIAKEATERWSGVAKLASIIV
ncbi:MAG: 50S ribosomal protein L14 [Candidatus Woesearchaeota archaeon]